MSLASLHVLCLVLDTRAPFVTFLRATLTCHPFFSLHRLLVSMGADISICSSGQMGVATTIASTGTYYGVLLTNGGKEISASNAIAQSSSAATSAPCVGTWDNGASVTCNSNGVPTSAIDTEGNPWTCVGNTSPVPGAEEEFSMYACCSRG
ncbi:uncharacterized protein PHACADRAFT_185947 [Phanerochaete carnosa HHB-10118-sp]|uniref:Ig-like domain-containing protein n=1 Tax=Phanerochaete carnosa (strain HHB-10118-sp) TaxID=650164 RepID=K5W2B1_PHACS|nr:uncharacterized protein PHACADRAFT_185947 [Phanerochaete carnosa HHB-10118-sp]EKM53250.1 hypothetical protein PHACADRAFT_185947 [Phanerochaete carnosa HHB-10118-sp]